MAVQAGIEGKRFTNHSARKTLVKKLKTANQPRSTIIVVTGHTNERSLPENVTAYLMICSFLRS